MAQRTLMAVLVLWIGAGLSGCGKRTAKAPAKEKDKDKSSWEQGRPDQRELPTGVGRTEIEKIAVNYQQVKKLVAMRNLRFESIEALGWRISRKAQNLVDGFENSRKEKAKPSDKAEKLKAEELPDYSWSKWPQIVRDMDLVAINAKRLALAAADKNADLVRKKCADLSKAADRCLLVAIPPAPEGSSPK